MDEPVKRMNDPEFDAMMAKFSKEAAEVAGEGEGPGAADANREDGRAIKAVFEAALERVEAGLQVVARRCELISETASRVEQAAAALAGLPTGLEALRQMVERKAAGEESGRRLIDALHEELRGYKDAFLLEAILKPVLKDLISLYDDLDGTRRRIAAVASEAEASGACEEEIRSALLRESVNLGHAVDYLVEILERSEVKLLPESSGLADKGTVKVVRVSPTADPSLDGVIERSLRRGFAWRGRVLRPEEVSIWRANGGEGGAAVI